MLIKEEVLRVIKNIIKEPIKRDGSPSKEIKILKAVEDMEEYSNVVDYKDEALTRAKTLLKATYDLLKKADDSPYVENVLALTVNYDEAECDGSCLMDDIQYWFDEFDEFDEPVNKL